MKEHIPNKTKELSSLSQETIQEALSDNNISPFSLLESESYLTIIPVTLDIQDHEPESIIFDEVYSLLKVDVPSSFDCKLNATVNGFSLYNRKFEGCYIRSLQSEMKGFALIYNNGNNILELEEGQTYSNLFISPPFYLCLKEKLDPFYYKHVNLTLGYMATSEPTTPSIGTTYPYYSGAETEEEFIEIE